MADHVRVGEVDDHEAGFSASKCFDDGVGDLGALISGLKSYVGTSLGDGIISRASPWKGFSSPPLKK